MLTYEQQQKLNGNVQYNQTDKNQANILEALQLFP